ncbi:neutral zinc metallopeptidase [Massilia oculi]|uniref:Neutral zinc metallopeptidase n=1 Tax=Massilia hydrophila TaxID=3044279 RepID=A0ABS7Y9X0_9BURK|nr:neutral zinc metallopeptidase [Massilia oculi]MCA1856502.1 neutral zinc metallopeptidase [Massilia oculi]
MKWEGERESTNVEDRRGGGGGFGGLGGRSVGIGTLVIALVGGAIFGVDPGTILALLSGGGGAVPVQQRQPAGPPANDEQSVFVRKTLGSTEDAWAQLFSGQGAQYQPARLVLFEGATPTACGTGRSATGPFYCPADRQVYIDLSFFRLMEQRFRVEGEFAQAYVIAHEVGHHVQNLLGISDQVHRAQQAMSETEGNRLSVRLELQADCFAGIWAHQRSQVIEPGDVEAALAAATAIGDDALQRQSQGTVVPDSFTHGSSAQRVRWFRRGLESGSVEQCNTFEARQL